MSDSDIYIETAGNIVGDGYEFANCATPARTTDDILRQYCDLVARLVRQAE